MASSGDYQSLTRLIEHQVKTIGMPLRYDAKVARLTARHHLSSRKMHTILDAVNSQLALHTKSHFSRQAIAQVADQIAQLWMDRAETQRRVLLEVAKATVPANLNPSYKLYALQDVMRSVTLLPDVDGDEYSEYNAKKKTLQNKVSRLERLQRKKQLIQQHRLLIHLKIGSKNDIQNVLSPYKNEVRDVIAKLRVLLEKLTNLDHDKRERLKELLKNS